MSKCIIERINNGFIFREIIKDESVESRVIVFEDGPMREEDVYKTNAFEEEIAPLQKLFRTIMDYFGVHNSKQERKALDISIVDRKDFPIEDALKELKELREENEKLKFENVLVTEKLRFQLHMKTQNAEVLDMSEDMRRDLIKESKQAPLCEDAGE